MSAVPSKMESRRNASLEISMENVNWPTKHDVYQEACAPYSVPGPSSLHINQPVQNSLSQHFPSAQAYDAQQSMLQQHASPAASFNHDHPYGCGLYNGPSPLDHTQAWVTAPTLGTARAAPYQTSQRMAHHNEQPTTSSWGPSWQEFVPSMQPAQTQVYTQEQLLRIQQAHRFPATQRSQPMPQFGPISGTSDSFDHSVLPFEACPPKAQQGRSASPHTEYATAGAHDGLSQHPRVRSSSMTIVTAESIAQDDGANGQTSPPHRSQAPRSYRPQNQPGPCKASEVASFTDGSGVPWISFEYHTKHIPEIVKIRTDIRDVNVEDIPEDFKLKNLCYQGAYTGVPKRKGKNVGNTPPRKPTARLAHERECNVRGWKLAWKNKAQLAGQSGKLQRAENSYCNAMPGKESRRVRKQRRRAATQKKADAQQRVPVEQQRLLPLDTWTSEEQSQVMPAPQPSVAPLELDDFVSNPDGSSPSSMSTTMPPTPRSGPSSLQAYILQARHSIGKRPTGHHQSSRPVPTSMPRPAENNAGVWPGSAAKFGCSSMNAIDCTKLASDAQWQEMVGNGSGSYPQQSYYPYASLPVFGYGIVQEPQDLFDFGMPNSDQEFLYSHLGNWGQDGYEHGFVIDAEDDSGPAIRGSDGESGTSSSSGL